MKRLAYVIVLMGALGGCQHNQPEAHVPKATNDPRMVRLDGGVEVLLDSRSLRIPGMIAIDQGWLEVFACMQGTRDHEAIFVTAVKPGIVHAGLLMLGLESGSPATYDRATETTNPPKGEAVAVVLEWAQEDGSVVRVAAAETLFSERGLPVPEFVFAGSIIAPNTSSMGPGEHYVADYTGNIVGLATFGDEVVASVQVHSPELSVEAEAWRIKDGVLPPSGTPAWLELRAVD